MDLFDVRVIGSRYYAYVLSLFTINIIFLSHRVRYTRVRLHFLSLSNNNIILLQTGAEWLSELESNVDDRNDVLQTTTGQTGNREDSKENFFKHLTKLTVLPPLKNDPATRLAFKPVTSIFQIKFDLF